jgi:hypothetical protein
MHCRVSDMQVCNETLTRLHIPVLSKPIVFDGCAGLADEFSAILRGWNLSEHEAGGAPIGTVRSDGLQYSWVSEDTPAPEGWDLDPPRTEMEAVCDLHFELVDWFLDAHADHLCVHCAAAEFGSGLVVFPSPTKAGKSTLTLQLAAAGHRIFCDDVLPIEPVHDHGFALGILPRVRLPLPRAVVDELGPFLDTRSGPRDRHYHYVDLAEAELAPLGTTAPVAALVLLERQNTGPACLEPVSHGEMLKLIIGRNFGGVVPAPEIFDRLHKLAGGVPRFRLTYAQGNDAIQLLEHEFGAGSVREGA